MHVACAAGEEVCTGNSVTVHDVPVLAFYQTPGQGSGRIVVFGDSNCLDSAHLQKGERLVLLWGSAHGNSVVLECSVVCY